MASSSIKLLLCAAGLAFFGSSARAALTVQVSPGSTFSVPEVVDFSPNGFDMSGLRVTATFSDTSSETISWSATSPIAGHAVGVTHNWSLTENGDTFYNTWSLVNNDTSDRLLKQLRLEGGSFGHTLFDLQGLGSTTPGNTDPATGTLGSQHGYTFDPLNQDIFSGLDITVTYTNLVKLDPASTPVGDLYTALTISFGGSAGGLLSGHSVGGDVPFMYFADTDLCGAPTNPVPESGSLALFAGLGLIGAWQYRALQLFVNQYSLDSLRLPMLVMPK